MGHVSQTGGTLLAHMPLRADSEGNFLEPSGLCSAFDRSKPRAPIHIPPLLLCSSFTTPRASCDQ